MNRLKLLLAAALIAGVPGLLSAADYATGRAPNSTGVVIECHTTGTGALPCDATTPLAVSAGLSAMTTNPTSTLTMTSATTAYGVGQVIASSATAGSIVVPSFAIANAAGGALISRLRLASNDATSTSWGAAGVQVDLWSAAPTFTSGDRVTWALATGSAAHLGSFSCTMSAVSGDGTYCEAAPNIGSAVVAKLAAGAAIYWTLQTTSASGITGASKVWTLTAEVSN